ncbi:MAG: glycosyltransferase family 39 protein, partial [Actinobacteria bacterium]|nr:glycosyltransferase family 39 protein [Actinomycetota bacterium]
MLLYGLGEKDFWERAEARSALAAREMLSTDEFLIPTLNGEAFVDNRPPGFYWLVALSFRATGVQNELTARLPAALLGLGCVLAVYRFGRDLAGSRCGFLAGLILLGTVKFTLQARSAEQDAALTFWTFLAA